MRLETLLMTGAVATALFFYFKSQYAEAGTLPAIPYNRIPTNIPQRISSSTRITPPAGGGITYTTDKFSIGVPVEALKNAFGDIFGLDSSKPKD